MEMPITEEGLALGHRYVMGNVNAYCAKCSEESTTYKVDPQYGFTYMDSVVVFECRYDDGDDTEYCETDIGFNAECGDEAIGTRDGFPVCQVHADRFDWALAHQDD